MSLADISRRNARILSRLKDVEDWTQVGSVHVYQSVSQWNEVDTSRFIAFLEESFPAIDVVIGNPDRSAPPPKARFDVIIVPIVVFDSALTRLGFGGGWYDRFLASQMGALKVGLAYEFQRTDVIEARTHDIGLDMIITDSAAITK